MAALDWEYPVGGLSFLEPTMRYLAAVALLWLGAAQAQPILVEDGEAQFRIGAPTQRSDGSALPPEEIAGYMVLCGPESGGPFSHVTDNPDELDVVGPDPAARFPVGEGTFFTPGTWYCVYRTVDTVGQNSNRSDEESFVVPEPMPAQPNPPTWLEQIAAFLKRVWSWFA